MSTPPPALKIVFAGTPEFAASALAALIEAGHNIVAVYCQPDRPAGRGRKLIAGPVKALALEQHIPVEQPLHFKDADTITRLENYQADVMVVAAYGLLLPEAVLAAPRFGCLNIHASLLPRWRGAAPIQHAILAGDKETGVTIMQMDKGLDTGDMLLKHHTQINNNDSAASLHDRLAQIGGNAILESLSLMQQKQLTPEPQNNLAANYAHKINKADAKIDWQTDAQHIDRHIRAYNPWPVAHTTYQEKIIRVWQAAIVNSDSDNQQAAGAIVDVSSKGIQVQCAKNTILLEQIQLPNSKRMLIKDILNGHPDLFVIGECFV